MGYREEDLVKIAKRENNKKRGYLVVNPLQAKHIPASPEKALEVFETLAGLIRSRYAGERLLLVGFAETATAIGAQAAVSLGAKYIQTTREAIPDVEYLFFSEEHSHATEQKLVKDDMDRAVRETDRIVFVEDEVTTGKTILNIVSVIEKVYLETVKYSVASLLNGMAEESLALYKEKGIDLLYLRKTDHAEYGRIAERFAGDGIYHGVRPEAGEPVPELRVDGAVDARRLTDGCAYGKACEELWQAVAANLEVGRGRRILVLGTEEFMYPALYTARKIELLGNAVFCHSTTRSPIAVSREEGYPLHERYELKSLFEPDRRTFLYDIGTYDQVLIITDAARMGEGGLASLAGALRTKNDKIRVVRWCKG